MYQGPNKYHKTIIRIFLSAIIIVFLILLQKGYMHEKKCCRKNYKNDTLKNTKQPLSENLKRESITFILGDDREADNPYYAEATNYYLHNDDARTEYVITECRSLLEVRDYLANNPPRNNQPWGLINLVSHGNQWMGLSVKVTPDSKRSSTERIIEYAKNGVLKELPNHILDSQSEIFIHGCGVGNNPYLIKAITDAFGGTDTLPVVRASKLFEYYASVKNSGAIVESQQYLSKAWFTVYKRGYRPEDPVLYNRLKGKYPDSHINWQDALGREQPRWAGDIYHYTFDVPVKWVIPFPHKDSLPDLGTKQKELDWIRSQPDIMETLNRIEIPVEKFNWWFRSVYVNNEDGSRSPAIWLKGYSTILCVLKPLVNENEPGTKLNTPFRPLPNDEKYYFTYNAL